MKFLNKYSFEFKKDLYKILYFIMYMSSFIYFLSSGYSSGINIAPPPSVFKILISAYILLFLMQIIRLKLIFILFKEKEIIYFIPSFITLIESSLDIQIFRSNKKKLLNKLYNKLEDEFASNIKYLTNNMEDKYWLLKIKGNKKPLLLSKDILWYADMVSLNELFEYFKPTINEIIKNEEFDYYENIYLLFEKKLKEEDLNKIKEKLINKNSILILQI